MHEARIRGTHTTGMDRRRNPSEHHLRDLPLRGFAWSGLEGITHRPTHADQLTSPCFPLHTMSSAGNVSAAKLAPLRKLPRAPVDLFFFLLPDEQTRDDLVAMGGGRAAVKPASHPVPPLRACTQGNNMLLHHAASVGACRTTQTLGT